MGNPVIVPMSVSTPLELNAALTKQLMADGKLGRSDAKTGKDTVAALLKAEIPSKALYSPYTKGQGKVVREDAKDVTFLIKGLAYSWAEVYEAVMVPIAKGWCGTAKLFELYNSNDDVSKSRATTRTEMTQGIEGRGKSRRRALSLAEDKRDGNIALEIAQGIEDAEKGDDAETLKLKDFMPKRGSNDKKEPVDFASDCAIRSIRRLGELVEPKCDTIGAIAAFRLALVCMNVADPTLDAHDPKNG